MRVERVSPAGRVPERGVALIAALLIMLLMSALMIGFTTVVMTDQRYRGIDKDRTRAFYGAQSGLEKLTADIGTLFLVNVAPTPAQIAALSTQPPTISGVTFTAPSGVTPYGATKVGNTVSGTIQKGPYQGLIALKTYYDLDVVAKTTGGGEAHLKRRIETVAIPVFQFGIFSDVDLAFFAGAPFGFAGRVHTNGNLFLAHTNVAPSTNFLTLSDKVTAVREVVRQQLQNGLSIDAWNAAGPVKIATASGACNPNTGAGCRALLRTEGSVVDGPTSALNGTWNATSLTTYNGYIRNGKTGAKPLNLPLITLGGANTDLVRRPAQSEDVNDPTLYGERFYTKASLRILLSDTAADITNLPGIDGSAAPVRLETAAGIAGYTVDATHPPLALSPGNVTMATSGSTTADGDVTINAPIPSAWPLNPATLTVWRGSPLALIMTMNCTSITTASPWKFNTCKNAAGGNTVAVNSGDTIKLTINGVDVATTTTTVAVGGAASATYTVSSLTNFSAYNTFWLNDTLVTCRWMDVVTNAATPKFTMCKGTPTSSTGATVAMNARSSKDTGLLGGYIKIERQDGAGAFHDVTMEILNYGIAGPNLSATVICADPTPNAIVRLQRMKDAGTGSGSSTGWGCANSATNPYDYWPNVLFDTRESRLRDTNPGNTNLTLGGVMHYVAVDVKNLSNWFKGVAPYDTGTGATALNVNGYTVYFSDRRNNRNQSNQETGEYGFEDVVNPSDSNGTPNNSLDAGEDVNANGQIDTYGQFPNYQGLANNVPPGAAAPLDSAARPTTSLVGSVAKVNRAILFRHALKLINGGLGNIVAPGLTVATENPVYVQGNWNMSSWPGYPGAPPSTDGHVATSIIADSATLLSNNWNDNNSFSSPYVLTGRSRGSAPTYYRLAMIAGKGLAFPNPSGTTPDFGTDGGAHNFMRYLENGNQPVYYSGSIATFYYNRQATGTFKCCTTVYGAPTRNYAFDIDFLDPAKLPPNTPVFRDINSLGFTQEIRPGK